MLSTVTIGFDDLPDLAIVDDQYRSLGADFNGTATILNISSTLNPPFPPHSGSQLIYDSTAPIRVDAVDSKWSRVGGFVTGNRNITMTAYDVNGAALGSASTGGANYVGAGTPNLQLEVQAANIVLVQPNLEEPPR